MSQLVIDLVFLYASGDARFEADGLGVGAQVITSFSYSLFPYPMPCPYCIKADVTQTQFIVSIRPDIPCGASLTYLWFVLHIGVTPK
jgi:hypothetical protein